MTETKRIKLLITVMSLITIMLLGIAVIQENIVVRWKKHQRRYRELLLAGAATDAERAAAAIEIKLRQEYLTDLNRIDRCTTCHLGSDNPGMASAEQPLTFHSGDMLKHHPLSRFGCTVCHDGQGRATETAAAHGDVPHWPAPLLRGSRVYTSCGRCHYENDLYGADSDLFATTGSHNPPLLQDELSSHVAGGDAIARGKQLVLQNGCLGCHSYRRRGGSLGPDITFVGDRGPHDFDFTHVEGEHTVAQWLFEHFMNPGKLSPGTLMPDMNLSSDQADALTQYMLSLHRKKMPASHTPTPPRFSSKPATGEQMYAMFCNGCHGPYGQGSTVRDPLLKHAADVHPDLMVPSLNNPDTLAAVSDEYLEHIITNGRSDTSMIAWGATQGGLRPEEIKRLVGFLRSWEPPCPDTLNISAEYGVAHIGAILYASNCAACHGTDGEGGIGTTLNAPSFLSIASDAFIARTLIEGRPNTAMPAWKQLDAQQISDLIAHLRTWHPHNNTESMSLRKLAGAKRSQDVSAAIGKTLYEANCVMCHGISGQGDLGPSIATREFLTVVDNSYLYATLSRGRPGTGMPAWHHFSDSDMASIICYMRTWQRSRNRRLGTAMIPGDWDTGERLFQRTCAGCHGDYAEGGVGPQLHNPVFLETTTDAMLYAWIAGGKTGTQMRSFRKGGQGMLELSPQKISDVVAYIRSLERRPRKEISKSPNGRPEIGQLWFSLACSSCHGERGEGASGPSITNRGFLAAASDGYLMGTMALGRDGTEMRPVKKGPQSILSLTSDQVNDLVAYLRSFELVSDDAIAHNYVIPWNLDHGRQLYESNCSGCHGLNGKTELIEPGLSSWAPALHNNEFLEAATDGFLQATIVRGRRGTAMRPFGTGMQGMVDLAGAEIDDTVAYIRRWSATRVSPMTIPAELPGMARNEDVKR